MIADDIIHVALAFCDPKDTYCRHAAVTVVSIFANTNSRVCVHIVHDCTLTAGNMEKLKRIADAYDQEIDFINVENVFDEKRPDVSRLTIDGARGTLFRLLLPDITSQDKMIFLDCDIVVNMDIAELWNIPHDGRAVPRENEGRRRRLRAVAADCAAHADDAPRRRRGAALALRTRQAADETPRRTRRRRVERQDLVVKDLPPARDARFVGEVGAAREQHDAARRAGERTRHARAGQVEAVAPSDVDARERAEGRRHNGEAGEKKS